MSRVVFAFMWLAHFLPLRLIAAIGNAVGAILYWLIPERRRVTRINLERCFPQMPPRSRERLARAHFRAFCRSFLERGILWWAPRSRIERMVRIEGIEHLQAVAGGPVILLTPHFVGLEAPLFRISMDYPVASMYSRQKDPPFDRLMYLGEPGSARASFRGRRACAKACARSPRARSTTIFPISISGAGARCSCPSSACRRRR